MASRVCLRIRGESGKSVARCGRVKRVVKRREREKEAEQEEGEEKILRADEYDFGFGRVRCLISQNCRYAGSCLLYPTLCLLCYNL